MRSLSRRASAVLRELDVAAALSGGAERERHREVARRIRAEERDVRRAVIAERSVVRATARPQDAIRVDVVVNAIEARAEIGDDALGHRLRDGRARGDRRSSGWSVGEGVS
jgi:hypothetical protein